jgi:hypothetical protein
VRRHVREHPVFRLTLTIAAWEGGWVFLSTGMLQGEGRKIGRGSPWMMMKRFE